MLLLATELDSSAIRSSLFRPVSCRKIRVPNYSQATKEDYEGKELFPMDEGMWDSRILLQGIILRRRLFLDAVISYLYSIQYFLALQDFICFVFL